MLKTATDRSNTENSEEQKSTIASDASGGSDDITDEHIHLEVCVCLSVLLCIGSSS